MGWFKRGDEDVTVQRAAFSRRRVISFASQYNRGSRQIASLKFESKHPYSAVHEGMLTGTKFAIIAGTLKQQTRLTSLSYADALKL